MGKENIRNDIQNLSKLMVTDENKEMKGKIEDLAGYPQYKWRKWKSKEGYTRFGRKCCNYKRWMTSF